MLLLDTMRSLAPLAASCTNASRPSGRRLAVLALLLPFLAMGCDIAGSDSDAGPDLDNTLAPGTAAHPVEGVQVMAASGALESAVDVSADGVSAPTAETPLPEAVGEVGPYFRIGGSRNIDLSSQQPPLYVALPAPEDADPAHLALAVRIPMAYVTGTEPSATGYGWDVIPGVFEPERNVLVVPVRFLVAEGVVLSAVEHPEYNSPSMDGTPGETLFDQTTTFFSGETTRSKAAKRNAYKIKCKGFSGSGCGSSEKDSVRTYLKEVYGDFVSDFKEPDLRTPPFSDKYVWIIKKKGKAWCKGKTAGKYLSLTNKAITCYNGSDTPSKGTTRHEFFHGIQYNYPPISWSKLPKQRPDWIIEATAEIAESPQSDASTAVRSGGGLRTVDTPLPESAWEPNYPEYKAKDFWVYLINSRNSTPANILKPVFEQQSNMPNKPTAEKVDQLYSLADDHWAWMRNQAFESQITTGYDGALNGRCMFNTNTGSPQTISYDAGSRTSPKEEFTVVQRLSGAVMAVEVQTGASRIDLDISASTSDPQSFVKIYPPRSSPTTDCWTGSSQDASDALSDMMTENNQKTYYVLLGATTIDIQRSSFRIEISHQDRLTK